MRVSRPVLTLILTLAVSTGASAQSRAAAPADLDAYVARVMQTFDVPAVSLTIVKDGRVIVAKGYGVRKLVTRRRQTRRRCTPAGCLATSSRRRPRATRRPRPSLPLAKYAGTYSDQWYGDIAVEDQGGKLTIKFSHTPALIGDLEHWQYDTFLVKWRDRELRADAYITFALNPGEPSSARRSFPCARPSTSATTSRTCCSYPGGKDKQTEQRSNGANGADSTRCDRDRPIPREARPATRLLVTTGRAASVRSVSPFLRLLKTRNGYNPHS